MKKLHVLIPSLLATIGMPLVSMVGCGNGQDDPDTPDFESCLTIEALDDCEVYLENDADGSRVSLIPDLHYSIDYGNEQKYEFVPNDFGPRIPLSKGQKIRFWGNNPNGFCYDSSDGDDYAYNTIYVADYDTEQLSGVYNVSGNVMSLIDNGKCKQETMPDNGCFAYLFWVHDSDSIVDSSKLILPTKLTDYCFEHMFDSNKEMITGPKLPSKQLAEYCYYNMFRDCGLKSFDILPATELMVGCYYLMFYENIAMQNPPKIAATKLADESCYLMFNECPSLMYTTGEGEPEKLFFTCPDTTGLDNPVVFMFNNYTPKTNERFYRTDPE